MGRTIIHVDMDAFYAAVEIKYNPKLAGKPLIIGALPHERGVVATCSYEARKFGVRSGMSIKDAYRRCPFGIYMHPSKERYRKLSARLHDIWRSYTDIVECVALDEGYLDVTNSAYMFGGARKIAAEIKARTQKETGLTCSVGIGYSMTSAKLASEEKKPDGLFEIVSPEFFVSLIINRNVRVLYSVGGKTAEKLEAAGIKTVRDVQQNRQRVIDMLGKHGRQIVELADGIDNRPVTVSSETGAKSISREITFQQDITDFGYLKDVLVLLARNLSLKLRDTGLYCRTVTLKITYWNMMNITRSKSGDTTNRLDDIYGIAAALLDTIEKNSVRLIGVSLQNLSDTYIRQLTFDDICKIQVENRKGELEDKLLALQHKYGVDVIKMSSELEAEKHLYEIINRMMEVKKVKYSPHDKS